MNLLALLRDIKRDVEEIKAALIRQPATIAERAEIPKATQDTAPKRRGRPPKIKNGD